MQGLEGSLKRIPIDCTSHGGFQVVFYKILTGRSDECADNVSGVDFILS